MRPRSIFNFSLVPLSPVLTEDQVPHRPRIIKSKSTVDNDDSVEIISNPVSATATESVTGSDDTVCSILSGLHL